MTRRAARRRRWRIAMGLVAVAVLFGAWWVYGGHQPPAFIASLQTPAAAATTALPAPAAAPAVQAQAAAPMQTPATTTTTIAAEQLREEKWAEARRESIRVQQRLREEAAARRARAEQLEKGNEVRCVNGHRMKRVSNGWVDDGTC